MEKFDFFLSNIFLHGMDTRGNCKIVAHFRWNDEQY